MTMQQLAHVAEFAGLLIVAAVLITLTIRIRRSRAYRSAVGLALAAVFILFWVNGAVGIIGEPGDLANLMYVGVLAVGILGAVIARFEPLGMSRALFATALAQALVAVIALIAGMDPPATQLIIILSGFFVALYVASACLFQRAAWEGPVAGAGKAG
jgi:hypothetical protein